MDPDDLWTEEDFEDEIAEARNPHDAYALGLRVIADLVRGCYKTLFCEMCHCAMPCECAELEDEDFATMAKYEAYNRAIVDVLATLEKERP